MGGVVRSQLARLMAGRRAVITGAWCHWQRGDPRFRFTVREEGPLQRKSVPVTPRGAPGPILHDRSMALTWSIGAPGSVQPQDIEDRVSEDIEDSQLTSPAWQPG